MTYLRGLKHQLVQERTWDEEQEMLMKKVPPKNAGTMTVNTNDMNDEEGVSDDFLAIMIGLATRE